MSQKLALQYIEIDLDYCSLVYGEPPCAAAVADVAAATAVDPTLSASAAGVVDSVLRQVIGASLLAGSGNRIRITFSPALSGANTPLANVFVGHVGAVLPNFDGFQERVTFNGGDSAVTLTSGGASVVSDWIEFSFDHARGLVVSMDVTGSSLMRWNTGAAADYNLQGKANDSANVGATTVSGYTSNPGTVAVIDLIEVKSVATGAIKCFNSKATCQDIPHFTNDPVTLRFAVSTDYLPAEIECVPSIKAVTFDPATLSLGENLGQRASLTATFIDHRDSDTGPGGDRYFAERDYDPYAQGSYWGKFRARHPFVRGRALRWITGFVGDALADMTTRHFVIESFTGPSTRGEFSLVAKDVLKLADGDRALAPLPSLGFLVADITAVATTATLSPAGIGNSDYPASGYVAIGGREISSFTRSNDTLTLTRAELGTVAAAAKAQDRVQIVLRYEADDPADIITDLLENYAGVAPAYIPIAEWQAETAAHLARLYTATIANPTSVNTLISELIQQAALAVWWRDEDQTIGLQVLRGVDTTAAAFDETNVMADTLTIQDQPDKRVSQVLIYFAQKNPLTSLTDVANYGSNVKVEDAEAEADYGSAAIKIMHSRWIPIGGRTVAERAGALVLSRYRDPPRKFNFSVLRESNPVEPAMGRGFRIAGWSIQDATGAATFAPIEITRVNAGPDIVTAEAEEMLFTAPDEDAGGGSGRTVVYDFNTNNINLRSSHDLLYPTPVSGDVVNFYVQTGVKIGSVSTALPAVDVGSWPAGVTVNLFVLGKIQGKGGQGGVNNFIFRSMGGNGQPGGPALYTRFSINLTDAAGQIFSGGGGGGGVGYNTGAVGGPGGGGAGIDPGAAGTNTHSLATAGFPGTESAGGIGGQSIWNGDPNNFGGTGGGPGLPGAISGSHPSATAWRGLGGVAGAAIDGVSFVTTVGASGDRRGGQIN